LPLSRIILQEDLVTLFASSILHVEFNFVVGWPCIPAPCRLYLMFFLCFSASAGACTAIATPAFSSAAAAGRAETVTQAIRT